MQGLGLVLLEEQVYNPVNGQLITNGPGKYKLPAISNIPRKFNVTLLRDGDVGATKAVHSSKVLSCLFPI